ncbi:hypothetical protein MPDQ_003538 [Monascus purpureus]|uniref:RRM domain-containing protein n=1 Tax=Monascus purpureus TaxID=5098 RepID=A0A507QMQ5_MONPU|nr:hypothetical protein MPDQ_003538 [Monascus purpureus]BDD63273.1 hypothetical protein MAP00_008187 [Monascus purpureus]
MAVISEENHKKRKLHQDKELEIDISAPEPPSKKALRKAKKKAAENPSSEVSEKAKTDSSNADHEATPTGKRSDYGIWIGNLAFSVTRDDLRNFFTGNCSFTDTSITRIHLPKGPAARDGKSQNKGFAYVDFSTSKAAEEALGLSEHLLSGRRVLIKDAKNFEGRPEKPKEEGQTATSSSGSGNPPSKRIFVGNLSFDVTREMLEEHLGKCGTIINTHIATFQDSGKCKGYAWVEFEDLAAAEAAVKGFVMAPEDEMEEEADVNSGSEPANRKSNKPEKRRQKKIWVNQLMGRRMRIEFAEDATTRYKKRFGKEREGKTMNSSEMVEVEDEGKEPLDDQSRRRQPARTSSQGAKHDAKNNWGYDKETVQKLSGAIVEPQGKKITFD